MRISIKRTKFDPKKHLKFKVDKRDFKQKFYDNFIYFSIFFMLLIYSYLGDIIYIRVINFFLMTIFLFSIIYVFFRYPVFDYYDKVYKPLILKLNFSYFIDYADKKLSLYMLLFIFYIFYAINYFYYSHTEANSVISLLDEFHIFFLLDFSFNFVTFVFFLMLFFHIGRHIYRIIDDYLLNIDYYRDWGLLCGWYSYIYVSINKRKIIIIYLFIYLVIFGFDFLYFLSNIFSDNIFYKFSIFCKMFNESLDFFYDHDFTVLERLMVRSYYTSCDPDRLIKYEYRVANNSIFSKNFYVPEKCKTCC